MPILQTKIRKIESTLYYSSLWLEFRPQMVPIVWTKSHIRAPSVWSTRLNMVEHRHMSRVIVVVVCLNIYIYSSKIILELYYFIDLNYILILFIYFPWFFCLQHMLSSRNWWLTVKLSVQMSCVLNRHNFSAVMSVGSNFSTSINRSPYVKFYSFQKSFLISLLQNIILLLCIILYCTF